MRIVLNIAVLAFLAAGTWWLTGIDKTDAGESKQGHHLTRALRCIAVVFLSLVFLGLIESSGPSYGGIPVLILVPICIALVLRRSLSELFAHGFLGMIDPELHDTREFDPEKARRHQDAIAHLIQNGRRDEAVKLCEELKQSGEVDAVTLAHTLEFLGVKQEHAPVKPLVEADRLRAQGKFGEAEELLKSLLAKNPADDAAALLLMRLYAENLRQPQRAHEVLRALEKQPHVPAEHLEFARRSIHEWSRPQPPPPPKSAIKPAAKSVDDLLAQGAFGMAVEMLEEQLKAQPDDVELQLKLAEVHAVRCHNLPKAEKIIQHVEQSKIASLQQIAIARAKLAEWRK